MEFTSQSIAAFLMIGSTAFAYFQFQKAANWNKWVGAAMALWLMVQMILAQRGFYSDTETDPTHLLLMVIPPMAGLSFITSFRTPFTALEAMDVKDLTLINIVRIPIEIALYLLSLEGLVPKFLTFEGYNFNIIIGITAPVVAHYGYTKKVLPEWLITTWHILGTLLLMFIVFSIVFSVVEYPFFTIEEPIKGIADFPYLWLPTFIVPLLLLIHIKALLKYMTRRNLINL